MITVSPLKSVDLVKRNPAKKMARFYRLAIWPDLFGVFALVREFGRIGQGGRVYVKSFDEEQAAIQAFERLLRQKTRRGYGPAAPVRDA
jgi:predicted DNA-binding WGR domain protein